MLIRGLLALVAMIVVAFVIFGLLRRSERRRSRDDDGDDDDDEAPTRSTVRSRPAQPGDRPRPAAVQPRQPETEPEPEPVEQPTAVALTRAEVFRRLYAFAFDYELAATPAPEHAKPIAAAERVLQSAATDPRYAPRRPLLLPQLMQAVNDSDTSRRELAALIAKDPSLVGSLLKLANSPFYRRGEHAIESIDRAITILGLQGVRSLLAAALVQPVFKTGNADTGKFPEVVWELSQRAGTAAEVNAALENADLFAAQLLALVSGLALIVVFRVVLDQYRARPDPTATAELLEAQAAKVAVRIAASWEVTERMLAALEEQLPDSPERPASPLGRALRAGLVAGAVGLLEANGALDAATARATLASAATTP
jgi:HD-like signal output (HDOD) protein